MGVSIGGLRSTNLLDMADQQQRQQARNPLTRNPLKTMRKNPNPLEPPQRDPLRVKNRQRNSNSQVLTRPISLALCLPARPENKPFVEGPTATGSSLNVWPLLRWLLRHVDIGDRSISLVLDLLTVDLSIKQEQHRRKALQ
jgi:hypothetical protein